MTKIWAGPSVGWVYLVCVIDCCTREIVGWESLASLPDRRRADSGEQAVLERLPAGSREAILTLTTDNGTQFTSSRFLRRSHGWASRIGGTAYHHPEGQQPTSSGSIAA